MNYKVLAISAVIGVGLIAVGLMETNAPTPEEWIARPAAMTVPMPSAHPRRSSTMDSYPAMAPAADRYATVSAEPPPMAPVTPARPRSEGLEIPAADIPVGLPQVAYVFSYGFRLAGGDIPALQQRHADLCESKGPMVCRIVSMNQATDGSEDSAGSLQLAVASNAARAFGKQLTSSAESADAEQVSAAIAGEDLSKQIVDTEARLRARALLRDRLMDVLASRRGTVTELVEAERGVAQVNEEIDEARSWLTQMKGRVAFSQIDIDYRAAAAPVPERGFMDPVRGAVGALGTMLGALFAVVIVLGSLGLPVLAGVLGARWLWRRFGPRMSEVQG